MIGIIMLNTRFPRLPGDIGNPDSFALPACYHTVDRAKVADVVTDNPLDRDLLRDFKEAARRLEKEGATVIGTSCGFLSPAQTEIAQCVSVPVLSSSLLLIPLLRSIYDKDVDIGVLTFDQENLKPTHFNGEYDDRIQIQGLPRDGELYRCISEDRDELNREHAERDVLNSLATLLTNKPKVSVLINECTNISPYNQAIKEQSGLPVYDLVGALEWIYKTQCPG